MKGGATAERRLREERTLLILTLLVLVLAALASVLFRFRLDLTGDRAFTLSPASRSLKTEIPETVSITYYLSSALSDLHTGTRMALDLLREMEAQAAGRIRVSVRDPGGEPGKVEALGVYPRQLEVEEGGERRIATVYAGVIVEYLDDYRVLPVVLDADNLEYEILKAVRSLVSGIVPVAALREGDGDKDAEGDFRLLRAALVRAGYEVRSSPRGGGMDADVSVLFLLGNAALDEQDAYYVDRYLASGGRVFAAVRGVRVDPDRDLAAAALGPSPILELLETFGITVRRELVLDASNLSVPFQVQGPGGETSYRYVRYPHWVVTERENVAAAHPATARYAGLDLFWPAPLDVSPRSGLSPETLVKSTPGAWKQTRAFAAGPEEEARYRDEEETTRGQYTLAVAVSGLFPQAYAGRLPARRPAGAQALPGPVAPEDRRPGRLVVVGSSDFLTDLMGLSGSEANAFFAVAAADWLSSDSDLPLPAGPRAARRLRPIEGSDRRRLVVGSVYILNILLVPALVGLYALLHAARRRKAENASRNPATETAAGSASPGSGQAESAPGKPESPRRPGRRRRN